MVRSLFGNLGGGHATLEDYRHVFSPTEFKDFFKFAFVRNPWDRLLSAFLFLKKGGMNEEDRAWAERNLASFGDFDSFVRGWVNVSNIQTQVHFWPQHRLICLPGEARPRLDFLGRFERLEEHYAFIREKLGAGGDLEKLNRRSVERPDYRAFYSQETRHIVERAYERDIRMLGYEF